MAHGPFQISHSTSNISHPSSHTQHITFHIPHSTFHIPPSTSTIPHSQHSSPKSTRFFPSRPALRPNTPFSAPHCNRLTFSHLSFADPPRHIPNTPFPATKRHLSTLHPRPFEAPSLTFRPSIPKPPQLETCPTPAPPLAYGLSSRPQLASEPLKPRLPALCFTQNPDTRFAPNIFNVVWFSSYRLLGVERGMIYQVDSWIDGLGMMQKCNERSIFSVVAQSAAVEQATE